VIWVRAQAVRWVGGEPIPGWVEVHLDLADGTVVKLFDKPSVFASDDRLRPDSAYPVSLQLACESASADRGARGSGGTVQVTLAHGVSNRAGVSVFWVREQDVIVTASD
jgi:hypothetical protein